MINKTSIKAIILSFFVLQLLTHCSTQRNNTVNRNLHELSTKYNVLFNGEEALKEAVNQIKEAHQDNFFELLPVEAFDAKYEISLPGQNNDDANLTRAEEKAVKAIQKHSMDIHGVQENNQIDNAYLLLGKSRYYQKRFMAALDAFNYELDNDFKSDIRPLFKLWKGKTNIRMENYTPVVRNLSFLGRQKQVSKNVRSEAYAYAAQALINMDSLQQAAVYMKKAVELATDKEKKARYAFISAQLLQRLNLKDSAIQYLQKIETQKRPVKYSLQAELLRYHLSLDQHEQHPLMLQNLFTKLKRYEYHNLYPYINYEIGEIYHSEDSLNLARNFYTKAAKTTDRHLQEKAYEKMADIGFTQKNYILAGAYLDSLLQVMPKETLKYLKTRHKRNNIEDIIVLEKIIKRDDSILKLVHADSIERVKIISTYIAQLKKKEAESNQKQENKNPFTDSKPKYTRFYFYNQSLVEKGKNNFNKIWGNISLNDMWRLNNQINTSNNIPDEQNAENEKTQGFEKNDESLPEKYQIGFYYRQIPTKPTKIDSISSDLNYAHYQAGMIYFEKFKELEVAKKHLQTMLATDPKQELIPPAKYNLYKIHKILGEKLLAEHLAQEIVQKYPKSIYAELIKHPDNIANRSDKAFQQTYKKLYRLFEAQQYDSLMHQAEPALVKFSFHPELGKIELLQATAIGRSKGLEAYKKALQNIILKYPKSPYQIEAQKRLKLVKQYKNLQYSHKPDKSYKVVIITDIYSPKVTKLIQCLKEIINKHKSTQLNISKDPFNAQNSFVVIHNFYSLQSAQYFSDLLKNSTCAPKNYFVISSKNYKTLQLTKKLEAYQNFIKNKSFNTNKRTSKP